MFFQSNYEGDVAQAGFNVGNDIDFFMLKESDSSDILNLSAMSNVNKKGKFIFSLDFETINRLNLELNETSEEISAYSEETQSFKFAFY